MQTKKILDELTLAAITALQNNESLPNGTEQGQVAMLSHIIEIAAGVKTMRALHESAQSRLREIQNANAAKEANLLSKP